MVRDVGVAVYGLLVLPEPPHMMVRVSVVPLVE
jgi:hypothetical protein